MQIDFLGMHAFLCIVEQGGFLPAAAHLNLSQAAISHRIRKLEENLGTRLLVRTTRDVTLTDAGRALLPGIRNAVRELENSYDALRQYSDIAPKWLAFGCLPTLAGWLPEPLRRFSHEFPDIAVRVFDDTVSEITQHVESDVAAFGISTPEWSRSNLVTEDFAEEPFVLACTQGHRLASRRAVTWDDLQDEVLIRISFRAGNSATIDAALSEQHTRLRWGYEAQRTVLALDLVAAGVGLTIVPALSAMSTKGIVAVPLAAPAISRRLAVVTRRGVMLSRVAQTLRDAVVAEIRTTLAHVNG